MAKKYTNPEVRFAGFAEDWEERELNKILKERKVMQKITKDAPILAFAAGQGVIDRSERKSNNRDHLTHDQENKIYKLTELNDIVYNPSNLKYGAIDRNKHGRGVISPIYVTFTSDEEPSFVELLVKSEKFKLRALQYEEGTVVKRQSVKPENLLSLKVYISPSKNEQKQIGRFFENLERLIEKHQSKHDKLLNIKKALLEKTFPRDVSNIPQIRFNGFSGKWLAKSIGELVDFSKGKGLSWNDIHKNGKNKCILYGHLYTSYGMLIKQINYKTNILPHGMVLSKAGDVLIPSSDTTPTGIARAACIDQSDVILGGDINILRPKENTIGSFLSLNINANRNKLIKLIKGTTVKHLYNSDIKDVQLFFPENEEEQKCIANLFQKIDELIELHSAEMKKFLNLKNACFQKILS